MKWYRPQKQHILVCFFIVILFGAPGAWSAEPSDIQTVQLFFENDLFGRTDKYYTNAVQITWLSKDLKKYKDDVRLPEWSLPLIRSVPFARVPGSIHNIGLLAGQHIYTPSDIRTTDPMPEDRPYAGFLYVGIALHSKKSDQLDTVEIVTGIVGPDARAEWSQNTVHDLRQIPTARGWHHQLHNEAAFRFAWQRKWRVLRSGFNQWIGCDLTSHTGVTLGNVRTSASAGGEFRIGYQIPMDFGSDMLRPGAGISSPVNELNKPGRQHGFGVHLFSSAQTEFVLRDIFLDGNTFGNSPDVSKKNWVADISAGIALNWHQAKLTYRHIFRTRQFDNQKKGQTIGSLGLTISF